MLASYNPQTHWFLSNQIAQHTAGETNPHNILPLLETFSMSQDEKKESISWGNTHSNPISVKNNAQTS